MQNPWLHLPLVPPYVLPDDYQRLVDFNNRAKPDYKIVMDSLPEPFVGDPRRAKVILLCGNPGDADIDRRWHRDRRFTEALRRCITHDCQKTWPFFLLDPMFAESGGGRYWSKRLREIVEICGLECTAERIALVDLFPYHSRKMPAKSLRSVAQPYSYNMVAEAAADEHRVIVATRSRRVWQQRVPSLSRVVSLRSTQCTYVSRGNLHKDDFERIVEAIRS